MKQNTRSFLSSFAAALLGVVSLAPLSACAKSSSEAVRLRIELDRPVLSADRTERAVIKIALDGLRLPRILEISPARLERNLCDRLLAEPSLQQWRALIPVGTLPKGCGARSLRVRTMDP